MNQTSFRPDVFGIDPPTLLGSQCMDCDRKAFPPRDICPHCGADECHAGVELSRDGVVYSYTIVRQAPAGLETPYVLGYVDLPQDEVRVMSRIEGVPPEKMQIGLGAQLTTRVDESKETEEDVLMFAFDCNVGSGSAQYE